MQYQQYYRGAISNVHSTKKFALDSLAAKIIPDGYYFKSGWLDDTSAWKKTEEFGYENFRYTFKVTGIDRQCSEQRAQAIAYQWASVFGQAMKESGIDFVSCQHHRTVSHQGRVYYKVDVRFKSLGSIH